MANTGNTQQQINYGAAVNDGEGDPLRTAFIKTDDNFDNVWLAGPVGSNITITNNTVQVNNTNGNLILSPNGTGAIQTNSRLLPRLNNTYDFGSTTLKYRTGYFGAGGVVAEGNVTADYFVGNGSQLTGITAVSSYGNANVATYLSSGTVSGNIITTGNVSGNYFVGNGALLTGINAVSSYGNANVVANLAALGANPITSTANIAGNYFIGNGSQLTGITAASSYGNSNVAAYLPTYTGQLSGNQLNITRSGNAWSMIDGALNFPTGAVWYSDISTNDEFISSNVDGYLNFQTFDNTSNLASELHMEHGLVHINVYNGSLKQWEFNQDGTTHFPGDLLPQANLGGNLGSEQYQWNDLWVSNNTIYINSVPLTLTAGNVLTVNGEAVLSNDSDTAISTTGNITADYFIGNGSQLTGIVAVSSYGNANVVANLAALGSNPISTTGNVTASYFIGSGSQLTGLPAPTVTQDITSNGAMSLMTYDGVIKYVNYATVEPSSGNISAGNVSTTGNVSGNYFIGNGSQLTGIGAASTGNVTFNNVNIIGTGNLNLQPDSGNSEYLNIYLTAAADIHIAAAGAGPGNVILGTDEGSNVAVLWEGNVAIQAGNVAGTKTWTFDTAGNVTIPGNIVSTSTINIDNRAAGNGADIQLYSADDIVLQARDRSAGSGTEGGDINILAGDSAEDGDTSGGDIVIEAGAGGAGNVDIGGSGGFIRIEAGRGGAAIGNTDATAESGGSLTLSAGDAGNNNGNIDLGSDGGDVFIESGFSTGNTNSGGDIVLTTGTGGQNGTSGNVRINIPGYGLTTGGIWQFDATGNLTLPANTFAVNYANGTPVSISGGNASTGNVTFDDQIVIGTGDEFGGSGLYLAIGPTSAANLQYFRVRGGDNPTHLHLDTGNSAYYDQYFGNDGKFVKLDAGDFGNVVIGTENPGDSYNWTFSSDGNLTVPGNIQTITTGYAFSSNIANITTGNPTVIVSLAGNVFGDPETGQVTITNVIGTTEANNIWYFAAVEVNAIQLFNDAALNNPVDGTEWTAYVTGGEAVSVGYSDFSITGGNIDIITVGGNVAIITNSGTAWTFSDTGNLELPLNSVVYETNIPDGGLSGSAIALKPTGGTNADQQLLIYPTTNDANHLHLTSGNLWNTELFLGDDNFFVKLANTGNIVINSNDNVGNTAQWTFGTNGNLTLPQGSILSETPVGSETVTLDQLTDITAWTGTLVFTKQNATTYQALPDGPTMGFTSPNWILGYDSTLWFSSTDLVTWVAGPYAGTNPPTGTLSAGSTNLTVDSNTWTFDTDGTLTVPTVPWTYMPVIFTSIPVTFGETQLTFTVLPDNAITNMSVAVGAGGYGPDSVNLTIPGTTFPGGTSPANDIVFNVQTFESAGPVYSTTTNSAVAYVSGNPPARYDNIASTGNVGIGASGNHWVFTDTGNITLPGNIIAINYANGNRVTGNVTFRDEIVIGTGTSNVISGLYLAPSSSSANANMYLRVRGNVIDEPTHIHFDTGNNAYYNQFIGDDNKYIQLANTGNIVVNTNDNAGNTAQWNFNNFGTLTLPGGSRLSPLGANLDIFANGGYVNLITADESSRVGVSGAGGFITTAGGTWQFDTTGNLTLPTVANESTRLVGTRKVIGGLTATSPYSVILNAGGTPTVAYTSSPGTNSVKVTFATQSNGAGFQWEQFDVVAVESQDSLGTVNFVVSNRVKGAAGIADTAVTATMSGGQIQISLNLAAAQTSGGWSSFDAVEFGYMVD
jgi:hypothetical protein